MRGRKRRVFGVAAVMGVLVLIGGELVARFALQLGDPVLMQTHPTIEYLAQPDQDVFVYGSRHRINSFGMRSDDPPTDPEAFRILVLGDSVINGGRRTHHDNLGTTLAQSQLRETLGRPAWVGNASAGSWGPGNWRAYVQTFGTFDADAVIVVVSPHDIGDTPTFSERFAANLTTERPISALGVAIREAGARFASRFSDEPAANPNDLNQPGLPIPNLDEPRRINAERDLAALFALIAEQNKPAAMLYFPEADSAQRHDAVRQRLREITEQANAVFVDLGPKLKTQNAKTKPAYRDRMHPSAHGQRILAEAMTQATLELIEPKPKNNQSVGMPAATAP